MGNWSRRPPLEKSSSTTFDNISRYALREAVRNHITAVPNIADLKLYCSSFWQGNPVGAILKDHIWNCAAPDQSLTNGRLQMTFCPSGNVRSEYVAYKVTRPEREYHIQALSRKMRSSSWFKEFRRGIEALPDGFKFDCRCGDGTPIDDAVKDVTEEQWAALRESGIDCDRYFVIYLDRHRSGLRDLSINQLAQLLISDWNELRGLYLLLQGKVTRWERSEPCAVDVSVKKILAQAIPKPFTPEFSGNKASYELSDPVESSVDHGVVVNTFAKELEDKGLTVGNDKHRDLYVVDGRNRILTLFEVKTDTTPYSIYAGVGQLLLHAMAISNHVRRVLVVP